MQVVEVVELVDHLGAVGVEVVQGVLREEQGVEVVEGVGHLPHWVEEGAGQRVGLLPAQPPFLPVQSL